MNTVTELILSPNVVPVGINPRPRIIRVDPTVASVG